MMLTADSIRRQLFLAVRLVDHCLSVLITSSNQTTATLSTIPVATVGREKTIHYKLGETIRESVRLAFVNTCKLIRPDQKLLDLDRRAKIRPPDGANPNERLEKLGNS